MRVCSFEAYTLYTYVMFEVGRVCREGEWNRVREGKEAE